jgi:hypothetical protein
MNEAFPTLLCGTVFLEQAGPLPLLGGQWALDLHPPGPRRL